LLLKAGSLSVSSIASSDYRSFTLLLKEQEEIIAELSKDNEEKAAINTDQNKLIEELKAKP